MNKPKANYFPDTDTLAIELADRPAAESEEIATDVFVEFDADKSIVGIVIEHASDALEPLLTAKLPGQTPQSRAS